MSADSIESKVSALLHEVREEAYQRGWDDALKSIMVAAKNAIPARESLDPRQPTPDGGSPLPIRRELPVRQISKRAPWGLSIRATRTALERTGDQGIDWRLVQDIGKELTGFEMAEVSVRSTLWDMTKRGELIRRGDRYFAAEGEAVVPEKEGTTA